MSCIRYGKLRVENVARSRTSSPRRGALVFGLRLFKIERMLRIFVLFFTLFPLLALAQEEEFTADRPGITNSTDILPAGRLQWETGMGFDRMKADGVTSTTWTLNSSTLRWGIGGPAEVHLQTDYLYTSEEGDHYGGLANVAVGTKINLYSPSAAAEGRGGLLPEICLLANVFVPGGNDAHYLPRQWGGQLGLVFQHELTPWCTLNYDGELTWSDDERPQAFYGACLCFQLSDRLFLLAEEYNYNQTGGTESWVGLGAGLIVAPRLQLDLSTNMSLNYPKRYANLMVGVSWQLTK